MSVLGVLGLAACSSPETVTRDDVITARRQADEERQESVEARNEARQQIQKEDAEARAAKEKADEVERHHNAIQARDAFIMEAENKLKIADQRIEELREIAEAQEGDEKAETETRIEQLKSARQLVSDALEPLKHANVLSWEDYRDEVDKALAELLNKLGF